VSRHLSIYVNRFWNFRNLFDRWHSMTYRTLI
jgi:hypothetical protein